MPSKRDITREVQGLKDIQKSKTFRHQTGLGDSNDEAIEAQIEALENGVCEDDISDWESSRRYSQYACDAAMYMVRWLEGKDKTTPTGYWDNLH